MNTAKFVKEIVVQDPDSKADVEVSIFKHENGGLFGIDSSYIVQCFDDDETMIIISDPFISRSDITLTGV